MWKTEAKRQRERYRCRWEGTIK